MIERGRGVPASIADSAMDARYTLRDFQSYGTTVPAGSAILLLFGRELITTAFDDEHARLQGLPVGRLSFVLLLVVALSVVALLSLVGIVLAVVSVGVGIRRWHDVGVTGWATLIFFVPFVGLLVALYLCWKHGETKENQYGPVPDANRPFFHAVLNS